MLIIRVILKFDNRSILDIYSFIFNFTIAIILETLITGELITSTLPIFLIGSSIGYSLFWFSEIVVWRFMLSVRTKQTKYLQGIILLSRCTILVGLLYFLFVSIDIVYAIITCTVYLGGTWFVRFVSKAGDKKRGTNIEIFDLASNGLIVVLGFCNGYFVGKWIGGYYGNAEIGSKIGLVLGFVATLILTGLRAKQRRDAQKAEDVKEKNLLSPNIASLF